MNNSKKGSVFDAIGIGIFAFVMIVVIITAGIAQSTTSQAFEDAKADLNIASYNESADIVIDTADKYPVFWDFLIAFVIFGVWLVTFISAWILGNNPIFIVIFVIVSIPLLIVSIIFETVLADFLANAVISPYSSSYPVTLFIVDHLLLFSIFFIVSVGIALYMKVGRSG